jgi:hypothetical protein
MSWEASAGAAAGKWLLARVGDEIDCRLAVRAWLHYKLAMLTLIHQHPEGYVRCPICYGSEAYGGGPCPFCVIPGKPREAAGYVTPYYFNRHWDSPRWKSRRE